MNFHRMYQHLLERRFYCKVIPNFFIEIRVQYISNRDNSYCPREIGTVRLTSAHFLVIIERI